jgi:hypothetical protein
MQFILSTPVIIRHLWQIKTVVFPALVSNMCSSIKQAHFTTAQSNLQPIQQLMLECLDIGNDIFKNHTSLLQHFEKFAIKLFCNQSIILNKV